MAMPNQTSCRLMKRGAASNRRGEEMRFVLLPIELPDWSSLNGAIHWAQSRIYPLGDELEYAQESAIDADFGLWNSPDRDKWGREQEFARERVLAHLMTGQL